MSKLSRRVLVGGILAAVPTTSFAGKTNYIYDALGRVTGALYADGALATYDYDAAGNRTAAKNPYVGSSITTDCFDANYYLRAYPDIAAAGVDPYAHYMAYGRYEGRNPNSFFNTSGYLAAYPDVATAGVNPLTHYCNSGWIERRDPSGLFGTKEYLDAYPDILAANINPLRHYLQNGYAEGRNAGGDGSYRPV